jgi:16S rRNA processing protein RimM
MIDVVVGRIGKPHGLRGEVTVEVRTDDPDLRFAPGQVLLTDPPQRGPLTVTGTVIKPGSRVAFAEAVVLDGQGRTVATASSTLLVFPIPAA